MNRTHAAVALAAGLLLATGCSSEPTYDEAADECMAAVKDLPKGAQLEPRPKACEPLTEKDYNMIFASRVIADMNPSTPNP